MLEKQIWSEVKKNNELSQYGSNIPLDFKFTLSQKIAF